MPVIWSSQLWVEVSPNADEEITTTALDIKHLGCRLKPVKLGDVYGARGTCIALRMTTTLLSAVSDGLDSRIRESPVVYFPYCS